MREVKISALEYKNVSHPACSLYNRTLPLPHGWNLCPPPLNLSETLELPQLRNSGNDTAQFPRIQHENATAIGLDLLGHLFWELRHRPVKKPKKLRSPLGEEARPLAPRPQTSWTANRQPALTCQPRVWSVLTVDCPVSVWAVSVDATWSRCKSFLSSSVGIEYLWAKEMIVVSSSFALGKFVIQQ